MQGKTINGFTLQRLLGVGGMAEVWYAENEIGMKAAVKILSKELSLNAQMRERFLNEAKVMVQLDHPHIRKVYGYGSIDDRPAIIMEYLDGNDLKARLKHGQRFSDQELRRWWDQVVDALNYTHAQNIVHRDLKPSNLFLDQKGNVKLLDFGIAKVADTTSGTQTGSTLGTRIYMSPEQVKDPKRVGVKSDVYSLAVTFVHLLTGKAPYDSTTSSDYDIQVNIVTKPLDLEPLPAEWRNFLAPYLEKDPEKRPALVPFGIQAEANQPVPSEDDEKTEMTIQPEPEPQAQPRGRKSEPKAAKSAPKESAPKEVPSKERDPKESAPKEVSPKKKTPKPIAETPSGGGKSKKGILIGLAVAAAAIVLAVLLLKPKKEVVSLDTQAYNACQTVNDYRAYLDDYGRNAEHYADAKAFVDNYVADSLAKVELEKEETAYKQCVTIASCDSYLNSYPQGCHVTEVKAKKAELEAQAEAERIEDKAYNNCITIADCENYLQNYPNGRYVSQVNDKKADLLAQQKKPVNKSLSFTVKGVSFVMKEVEGGTFKMGSTKKYKENVYERCETPAHNVTLNSFYMGETEVTQALWKAVMESEPTSYRGWRDERGNNYPTYNVTWYEVKEFIRKLNGLTGKSFRLPTEAEWEYAARGGKFSKGFKYAGSNNPREVAWCATSGACANLHPVKKKSPNELGLYDMSGNVEEWCSDWFDENYYSKSPSNNPQGPSTGSKKVLNGKHYSKVTRGGHYCNLAEDCGVTYRHYDDTAGYGTGFRLCLPQ